MKLTYTIVLTMILIVSLGARSGLAQAAIMNASIPFNFNVGDVSLTAGEYTVRIVGNSVLWLQSKDGKSVANMITMPVINNGGGSSTRGKLVFTHYANQYFLSRAFWPTHDQGWELLKSRRELEVAAKFQRKNDVNVSDARK